MIQMDHTIRKIMCIGGRKSDGLSKGFWDLVCDYQHKKDTVVSQKKKKKKKRKKLKTKHAMKKINMPWLKKY